MLACVCGELRIVPCARGASLDSFRSNAGCHAPHSSALAPSETSCGFPAAAYIWFWNLTWSSSNKVCESKSTCCRSRSFHWNPSFSSSEREECLWVKAAAAWIFLAQHFTGLQMHILRRRDSWAWTFARRIADSRKSGNSRRPSMKWIDHQYLTGSRWSIAVSNLSLSFLDLVGYWEKNRRIRLSQFFLGRKWLHFGKYRSPMRSASNWKGSHCVFCVSLYSLWSTMKSKLIYF